MPPAKEGGKAGVQQDKADCHEGNRYGNRVANVLVVHTGRRPNLA